MEKIPRALISFAFVADRFESTGGDVFQGLVPLFAPIVQARTGEIFEPGLFAQDLKARYDIVMPEAVAQDWAARLEKEGYLVREDIAPGHVRYRYNFVPATEDDGPDKNIQALLGEFTEFVNQSPARGELPDPLDVEQAFFDRLVNLDSLAIFHRPDKPHAIRRTAGTLAPRSAKIDDKTAPRNPIEERLDFLFGSFVEHLRTSKAELFAVISDVTTGALLAEVVLGVQSPPSKGDEFEGLDIYLDAPLVMDLLGINPGRKDYAEDLIAALKTCRAPVWIFDHSVEEIERIITHRVDSTTRAGEQRLGYRYRTAAAASDKLYLISIKGRVASELQKQGIKINSLQGDPYQRSLKYFSEDDEAELMDQIGMYMYVDAKEADAKSLANVVRIRGASDIHPNVLRSRAVLVSRNGRLVNRSARYLQAKQAAAKKTKSATTYRPGDAPVCITDSYLLGLIWITRGGTTKSLSRSRLVANCAAAIAPRRDLVTKMFNLLLECDERKADRFEAIMIDERAERYLMQLTLGDESLVTNANVEGLYDEVRKSTVQELTQEHERELELERQQRASEAAALRSEYEAKLVAGEEAARLRDTGLRDQLRDEQASAMVARNELSETKKKYANAAARTTEIESALHSERRQRILPAFTEARSVRRRFPGLFGLLLATLLYAAGKLLTGDGAGLVGEFLSLFVAIGGFLVSFWDIPSWLFEPIRNQLATWIFRLRARSIGATDLLAHYAPDWEKDELIVLPSDRSDPPAK